MQLEVIFAALWSVEFLERCVCGLAAIHLSLQACKRLFESRHGAGCAVTIGKGR